MTSRPLVWDDRVADFKGWTDDFRRPDLEPGAAWWGRNDQGLIKRIAYICPCGCADWRSISVSRVKAPGCWAWDGEETRPTLTPSIQHIADGPNDCNWHGFLTSGVWRTN